MNVRFQGVAGGGADNFNRANGPLGPNWASGAGSNASIVANQYSISAPGTGGYSEWVPARPTVRHGIAKAVWTGFTGVCYGGPLALHQLNGINHDSYLFVASDNGGGEPRGRLDIYRRVFGVPTILATANPIQLSGFLFGGIEALEWDVQATQVVLKAYVNGILQCTAVDAAGDRLTFGKPGLGIQSFSGVTNTWDNFQYQPLGAGGAVDLRKRSMVTF
jgi:hypothetical protein